MFKRKKIEEGNTLKNEAKVKNTQKEKKSKSTFKVNTPAFVGKIKSFFENQRNQYIIGWISLFFSIFLFVSFISYFYSWKTDQDKLELWSVTGLDNLSDFEESEKKAENLMGTLGAKISHLFIYQLFGISSFFVPFIVFLIGLKLSFKKHVLPIKSTLKTLTFYTFLISSILAFTFSSSNLNPGGNVGIALNYWIGNVIGNYGLGFLQFTLLVLSLFIFFDIKIENIVGKLFSSKEKTPEVATEKESYNNNFKTVYPDTQPLTESESSITDDNSKEAEDQTEKENLNNSESETNIKSNQVTHEDEIENENNEDLSEIEFEVQKSTPQVKPKESEIEFEVTESEKEETIDENEWHKTIDTDYDPTLDLSKYQYPTLDLLMDHETNKERVSMEVLEEYKQKIETTLSNYKIEITSIKASIGPTVTLYEIVPAPGVRIAKIKNLEDDIALSLAALGIRIIAPIPGRGTVGIEVPNPDPDIVPMKSVLASKAFANAKMELPIALGKTISNETFVVDLAKMPHLLMAGATGQGKSVGLNCILVSLLYKKHPSQLKLVLVDPKKVELTLFNKVVRHFLAKLPGEDEAIITETQKVVNTLNSLCVEMDDRYELLKDAGCRNLKEYNAKFKSRRLNPENGHKYLPYIVLVIDEFADLIMTAGKEVEMPIARLAQLARAIGIHLIVATQRPSVNIITGTIKANFPARIAFRVTSKIDSRTILDAGGADQLIGRGDMLLSTGNDIIRIQCAFVDTPEVEKICEFIGDQQGYSDAHLLPEYNDPNGDGITGSSMDLEDRDALFEDAARVIVMHQQGSASLLQRKLKLGYNRAGRIVDQLEAAGIIGPFEGSKARQVLIPDEYSLEQLLNNQSQQ